IHDWRHHFAVWFLERGGKLRALRQIAGWTSMRMVQRYAVFEQSDLDDIMLRTAADDPGSPSNPEVVPSDCPP
ncbi:MAG: tyrosine-type recombinase/integrase, partial [Parafilimonas terrae]|nr:tyrosine-type recombinase/integrase [Parafilimonas terrae]